MNYKEKQNMNWYDDVFLQISALTWKYAWPIACAAMRDSFWNLVKVLFQ
jgi:hypothetical protein